MTDYVFRFWVAICAALAALAMIAQAFMIFAIQRTARRINERTESMQGRAEAAFDSIKQVFDENRSTVADLTTQALDVVSSARVQISRLDEFAGDVTERVKVQMDRIDAVVRDTTGKIEETTAVLQSTILKPVREVNGVVSGLRAALSAYARPARTPVDHATQDEEMFI
jgi:methyl-accepting chemotaxis protein